MGCCSSDTRNTAVHPTLAPKPATTCKFDKCSISTKDPSNLIRGFEKEPLLPLEEALKPFNSTIPRLQQQIQQAKSSCHYPSEHGLTHDESAAIYLFSLRDDPDCVYQHLDRAWKSDSRTKMEPWFRYLKLIHNGWLKLPKVTHRAWQGMPHEHEVQKMFSDDHKTFYTLLGIGSGSPNDVKNSIRNQGASNAMLFAYEDVDAKDVTDYLATTGKAVLIFPGSKIRKTSVEQASGSVTYVFTGNSHKELTDVKLEILQYKHFVCPQKMCQNACRNDHAPNRCYGFTAMNHNCDHHCGPPFSCYRCNKLTTSLKQCHKCEGFFCDDCSLKYKLNTN